MALSSCIIMQGCPKITESCTCSHFPRLVLLISIDPKNRLCLGNNGKIPGTSSQSEGYRSKWLIWLVCRETLHVYSTRKNERLRWPYLNQPPLHVASLSSFHGSVYQTCHDEQTEFNISHRNLLVYSCPHLLFHQPCGKRTRLE